MAFMLVESSKYSDVGITRYHPDKVAMLLVFIDNDYVEPLIGYKMCKVKVNGADKLTKLQRLALIQELSNAL